MYLLNIGCIKKSIYLLNITFVSIATPSYQCVSKSFVWIDDRSATIQDAMVIYWMYNYLEKSIMDMLCSEMNMECPEMHVMSRNGHDMLRNGYVLSINGYVTSRNWYFIFRNGHPHKLQTICFINILSVKKPIHYFNILSFKLHDFL